MRRAEAALGPVKAWIEPDSWALIRAFPVRSLLLLGGAVVSAALGWLLHPAFFVLTAVAVLRHAAAAASLRELFRDGMLHPAMVVQTGSVQRARGMLATLVRLESEGRTRDAVVISRMPRRWSRGSPPWGGARAAVVIAGDPPRLRPLSPDFAQSDLARARRAMERIPDAQWEALSSALDQLDEVREGVHLVELGGEPWYGSVSDLEAEGSLPAHLTGDDQHVWCAGLPAVEEPAMTDGERRRVARLRRAAWVRVGLWAALLVASVAVLAPLPLPPWALVPLQLASLVVLPCALVALLGQVGRVRAYGRDLEGGMLWRFAGSSSSFDSLGLDRDLAQLARRGVLAPEPGVEQDIVVLQHARELLHANGAWAPRGMKMQVSRVAAPPESPIKLALPSALRTGTSAALDVGRRRLTEPERTELARHVHFLRQPGAALYVLTPLALLVLALWRAENWSLPPGVASAPVVIGMWLFALRVYWRRRRVAAKLVEDIDLGWVITVDHGDGEGSGSDPELPARGVESLLHARLDWTVNRRPATWRRFGRGAQLDR